jgi:hypothetical protein
MVSPLALAGARWKLNQLASDDLPKVASELLSAGLDSPALREVAGWTQPIRSEVGPVFEKALSELGSPLPDQQLALRLLAKDYAAQIVAGTLDPYEGARRIWFEASIDYEPFEEVSAFVGLASQLDDYIVMAHAKPDPYAGYVEACRQDVVATARAYLDVPID